MATFDKALWEQRAASRLAAALSAGKPQAIAYSQWLEDVKYTESLRVVVEWCEARSLNVIFSRKAGGMYYQPDQEVRVSGRASPKCQLHLLLHECGHHLIGNKERYAKGYGATSSAVKRSTLHRIDVLDEEMEAWHRGWRLGTRIGALTVLDKDSYDTTRSRMLTSYVKWAARGAGYEKLNNPDDE